MFCSASWSFEHYLPLDRREKLIIDQVIPSLHAIRLAWSGGSSPWTVWYRVKDSEEAWRPLTATEPHAVLSDLAAYIEYEFRVESGADKSLTGYARTGEVPGTVVNYLHPQDPKYAFSGQHLCSPSLLLHPDGYLLASTDLYDNGTPQNLTLIFRSDDGGKSWYHYTELFPCFWGSLFLHRGEVYMLSTSTEYGDLLIGKSSDGGKTWGAPTVLARGSCHRSAMGWHKSGMPVTEYKGMLWCGVDYGSHQLGRHMNCLASADASGDLLDAGNWAVTDPLAFDPAWEGAVKCDTRGCIEGNAVVSPDGKICNFLRYSTDLGDPQYGLAAVLEGDPEHPDQPLKFLKFVPFPGNLSKFDVKWDAESGRYFSIVSRITGMGWVKARTILSLISSADLEHWSVLCDLVNYENADPHKVGFQYVSFLFDGSDLLYLSRTAFNGAQNFHDNNYLTFDRVSDFRNLLQNEQ